MQKRARDCRLESWMKVKIRLSVCMRLRVVEINVW